ncbi:hypothetical protein OH77DRAFT_1425571 [Trametes cingulata]|nr:hypothetical protein OH77DRAFT_1425571 [Trametes cingulata]
MDDASLSAGHEPFLYEYNNSTGGTRNPRTRTSYQVSTMRSHARHLPIPATLSLLYQPAPRGGTCQIRSGSQTGERDLGFLAVGFC